MDEAHLHGFAPATGVRAHAVGETETVDAGRRHVDRLRQPCIFLCCCLCPEVRRILAHVNPGLHPCVVCRRQPYVFAVACPSGAWEGRPIRVTVSAADRTLVERAVHEKIPLLAHLREDDVVEDRGQDLAPRHDAELERPCARLGHVHRSRVKALAHVARGKRAYLFRDAAAVKPDFERPASPGGVGIAGHVREAQAVLAGIRHIDRLFSVCVCAVRVRAHHHRVCSDVRTFRHPRAGR